MVCHIMIWIIVSEPIEFGIKYLYMYCFQILCDVWIQSLSNVISMIGITIIPPVLPSVYQVLVINIEELNPDLQVVFGIACGSWCDLIRVL